MIHSTHWGHTVWCKLLIYAQFLRWGKRKRRSKCVPKCPRKWKKRRKIVNNFHPFPERFPSCCVPSANVCLLWWWLLLYCIANSFFLQGIRLLSTSSSFVRSCRQAWRRRHFFIYFFFIIIKNTQDTEKAAFFFFFIHKKKLSEKQSVKKNNKMSSRCGVQKKFQEWTTSFERIWSTRENHGTIWYVDIRLRWMRFFF